MLDMDYLLASAELPACRAAAFVEKTGAHRESGLHRSIGF